MTDVAMTAVLTCGRDDFRTGRKVAGAEVATGDLSRDQLREYFAPAIASADRWNLDTVVLHDGLPREVTDGLPVRFCLAVGLPDWNAFERRWVAAINWLHARDDVRRVWMVDANDVLFVRHPFGWMDDHLPPGHVAVGREQCEMGGNVWYEAGVKPLPPEYADCLTRRHGRDHGLTCGCWAADRSTAVDVLDTALARINSLQAYLRHHPPGHPVCLDMFAFGVVWREQYADRLVPFAMDGETDVNGVPSPLIHNRERAMSRIRDGV